MSSTEELTRLLAGHQRPLSSMVPCMFSVAEARFHSSAALTPWTDAKLDRDKLLKIWMQVESGCRWK